MVNGSLSSHLDLFENDNRMLTCIFCEVLYLVSYQSANMKAFIGLLQFINNVRNVL